MGAAQVVLWKELRKRVRRLNRRMDNVIDVIDDRFSLVHNGMSQLTSDYTDLYERMSRLMSDNQEVLERVARLEGLVTAVSDTIGDLRVEVARLREDTDLGDELGALDEVISRLDALVAPDPDGDGSVTPEPEPVPDTPAEPDAPSGEGTDEPEAPAEVPADGDPLGEVGEEVPGDTLPPGDGTGDALPPADDASGDSAAIPVDGDGDTPGV